MRKVIAIFGAPAVGKSTVADEVASLTGSSVRHCGEIVKARAKDLGISLDSLSDAEHQQIDTETRQLAESAGKQFVIEGRFLDRVLGGVRDVLFVLLSCSSEERVARHCSRKGSRGSLKKDDDWTEQFRSRLYPPNSGNERGIWTLETDDLDPAAVARLIVDKSLGGS